MLFDVFQVNRLFRRESGRINVLRVIRTESRLIRINSDVSESKEISFSIESEIYQSEWPSTLSTQPHVYHCS